MPKKSKVIAKQKATPKSQPKVVTKPKEQIKSHPTMCLHCHLVVEMTHEQGADLVKGAWQCPRCDQKYPFAHWKIRPQVRHNPV